jgi:hypothetical protein
VMGGPMRCGSGGTPAGSIVGGKVVDVAGVAAALRQLLARTEIHESRAMIAVSDALASFRVLRFSMSTTDAAIDSTVAKEFPLDAERMATMWVDVQRSGDQKTVFAVAWDRSQLANVTEAVRQAGVDPIVVDLKSMCIARAVLEPSCVVVDLSADPIDIFLIDGHMPQVWHSFSLNLPAGEDIGPALSAPLRSVVRFYQRRRDTDFGSRSPILISGEQVIPTQASSNLSRMLDHPVEPLLIPPRVPNEVRHGTYLACLGLLMRRT